MTRVLFLTARRRLRPAHLEQWLGQLPGDVEASVVAMSLPAGRHLMPARRYVTLPVGTRPGALPVDQPVRGGARAHAEVLGGGRIRQSVQARFGSRLDERADRRRRDKLDEGLAERFAASCLGTPEVVALFAEADLVVAVDAHTTWAAWQLAQGEARPRVVYTLAGAARAISQDLP